MQEIFDLIEQSNTICVFRHQNPDPDALGSQWGLVNWLKESYPEKTVFAMGRHIGTTPHLFGTYEPVSDDQVKESLAIILDTANADRVDDQRFKTACHSIKIDHHPFHEHYAKVEFVDEHAASTSELVTQLIQPRVAKPLSTVSAKYLYMGILADTLRFSTRSTNSKTLACAAFLVQSHLNLGQINDDLFAMDEVEFTFTNYIRSHAVIEEGGLVYIKLTREVLEQFKVTPGIAKEKINELGQVRSFQVWAMFIQQKEDGEIHYNGSLRSRRVIVNDIANKYGGGGHKLAAAVKKLDDVAIEHLLEDLRQRIKEQS